MRVVAAMIQVDCCCHWEQREAFAVDHTVTVVACVKEIVVGTMPKEEMRVVMEVCYFVMVVIVDMDTA